MHVVKINAYINYKPIKTFLYCNIYRRDIWMNKKGLNIKKFDKNNVKGNIEFENVDFERQHIRQKT